MMKIYMKPELVVKKIQYENKLLAASPGVASGKSTGEEYNENDVSYSKFSGKSVWDEEEVEE